MINLCYIKDVAFCRLMKGNTVITILLPEVAGQQRAAMKDVEVVRLCRHISGRFEWWFDNYFLTNAEQTISDIAQKELQRNIVTCMYDEMVAKRTHQFLTAKFGFIFQVLEENTRINLSDVELKELREVAASVLIIILDGNEVPK